MTNLGLLPRMRKLTTFLLARVMYKAVLGLHLSTTTAEEKRTAPPLLNVMLIVSVSQNL